MPWPLTYMLTPDVAEAYQHMFALQLHLYSASSRLGDLLRLRPDVLTALEKELTGPSAKDALIAVPTHILNTRANAVRGSISLRVKVNWVVTLLRQWFMADVSRSLSGVLLCSQRLAAKA